MSTPLHIHAEQALLGAALHDPGVLDQLAEQVSAQQYERPYHQDVYQAMLAARDSVGTDADTSEWVNAVRGELGEMEMNPQVARDAVPLVDLLEAGNKTRPRHLKRYVGMVDEAASRRELAAHARRLSQVAHGDTEGVGAHIDQLRDALTSLRERYGTDHTALTEPREPWAAAVEQMRTRADQVRELTERVGEADQAAVAEFLDSVDHGLAEVLSVGFGHSPGGSGRTVIGPRELAARQAARRHRMKGLPPPGTPPTGERVFDGPELDPQPTEAAEVEEDPRQPAEERFLAAVADNPSHLDEAEWLTPGQWSDSWRRDLFELARGMHAAGEDIDPMTLAWRAQEVGLAGKTADVSADDLVEMLGGEYATAEAHAREIHDQGVTQQTAEAAQRALDAVDDPTTPLAAVVTELDARLADARPSHPAAQQSAEPEEITPPEAGEDEPIEAEVVEPDQHPQVQEYGTTEVRESVTISVERKEITTVVETTPEQPAIEPGTREVSETAQRVHQRITAARSEGKHITDDQVPRVLVDYYQFSTEEAEQVAEQVAQLDQEQARQEQPQAAPAVEETSADAEQPQAATDDERQAAEFIKGWNAAARERAAAQRGEQVEAEQPAAAPQADDNPGRDAAAQVLAGNEPDDENPAREMAAQVLFGPRGTQRQHEHESATRTQASR